MLTGIDVSQHQGAVKFAVVKAAGHDFVICKSTEGEDFIDPGAGSSSDSNPTRQEHLGRRVRAIRAAGLKVGLYHYLRPRAGRSGAVEANHAVKVAKAAGWGQEGDIRLVVDVEETALASRAATKRYVREFVERYEHLTGHRPVLYSFPFFLAQLGFKSTLGCPLWIAHFDVPTPTIPKPWSHYTVWQFTSHGSTAGVQGNVDLNKCEHLPLMPAKRPNPKPLTRRQRIVRRMRRARRKFLATHANSALLVYLISKARLGRWDERYCMHFGVDPNVHAPVRKFITRGYAHGLVPTSTTGGQHAPGSYHFQHRAADMGARLGTSAATGLKRKQRFQASEFRRFKRGTRVRAIELLGPINNQCVLKGQPTTLGEGTPLETMHDTHVHGAF